MSIFQDILSLLYGSKKVEASQEAKADVRGETVVRVSTPIPTIFRKATNADGEVSAYLFGRR